MDFFNTGIPLGRFWGINVRLHWTFLIYAYYRATEWNNLAFGLAYIGGLYLCILLHEFGHALAARWCDGDAEDILLWPLGGLAFVRPAFHPTAHLITTAAGPFVTLVLWLALGAAAVPLYAWHLLPPIGVMYLVELSRLNQFLLLFNLIPAFPMDGGRLLRDGLWYWLGVERATKVAVVVSMIVGGAGIIWALTVQNYWLAGMVALFILPQALQERRALAFEAGGRHSFSIRDRLRRGRRQRAFKAAVAITTATTAFHRCTTCGRTEHDSPTLEFRICPDCQGGEEYCSEHLDAHPHI